MNPKQERSKNGQNHAVEVGEKLLTLKEVAAKLQVSTRTVRAFVNRGELKGRIIGNQWRFRSADIDRFVEDAPPGWDFDGKRGDGD